MYTNFIPAAARMSGCIVGWGRDTNINCCKCCGDTKLHNFCVCYCSTSPLLLCTIDGALLVVKQANFFRGNLAHSTNLLETETLSTPVSIPFIVRSPGLTAV